MRRSIPLIGVLLLTGCLNDDIHRPRSEIAFPPDPVLLAAEPVSMVTRPRHPQELTLFSEFRGHRFPGGEFGGPWIRELEVPARSPDGSWFAWVGTAPRTVPTLFDGAEGPTSRYGLWRMAEVDDAPPAVEWVGPAPEGLLDLSVSDDGEVQILVYRNGRVWLWLDPAGAEQQLLLAVAIFDLDAALLSPSGRRVFTAVETDDGTADVWRVRDVVSDETWDLDPTPWIDWQMIELVTDDTLIFIHGERCAALHVETGLVVEATAPSFVQYAGRSGSGNLVAVTRDAVLEHDGSTWMTTSLVDDGVIDHTGTSSEAGFVFISLEGTGLLTHTTFAPDGRLQPIEETEHLEIASLVGWDPAGSRLLYLSRQGPFGVMGPSSTYEVDRPGTNLLFWIDGSTLGAARDRGTEVWLYRMRLPASDWEEVVRVPGVAAPTAADWNPVEERVVVVDGGYPFIVHEIGFDGSIRSGPRIYRSAVSLVTRGHPLIEQLGPLVVSYGSDGDILLHAATTASPALFVGTSDIISIRTVLIPDRFEVGAAAYYFRRGPRFQVYPVGSLTR